MSTEHYTQLADEQSLLQQTADGSREAFSTLYAHYYPGLYRFVFFVLKSREDAEEIIQDVFLKIWLKRETLTGIRSFNDYLFRMAKNRLFDINKQLQAKYKLQRQMGVSPEDGVTPVFDELLFRQYHATAQEAIHQLPERRRTIFLMNAQQELTAREIAAKLGFSVPAVKKDLREASHFIRDYLRKHAGWILSIILYWSL